MTDLTTIPIHKKTRDTLKMFGRKGDTYDVIIRRLIENIRYKEFIETQYNRLKEKENFISLEEL